MKFDMLNNALQARGQWKCIVAASSSVQLTPPPTLNGGTYVDGYQSANGGAGLAPRRIYKLTCQGGGTVGVYDADAVGNAVAASEIWTKTVTAGDIYDFDVPLQYGLYVITGAGAQVTVVFD